MNDLDRVCEKFDAFDLRPHLVALGVMGSESHGTRIMPEAGGIDDTDYMGIVIPPVERLIGLRDDKWEHWVYGPDDHGLDVALHALEKFVRLLLKSNPNVLGFLWLNDDQYMHRSDAFDTLRLNREAFSSLEAHAAFIGYADEQIKKMQSNAFNGYMGARRKAIVERHGYDTKNACHLIRLLRTGIEFLDTGRVNVFRHDREELKAIKRGEWSLERVKKEAEQLYVASGEAKKRSPLPAHPDRARAVKILIQAHCAALDARETAK